MSLPWKWPNDASRLTYFREFGLLVAQCVEGIKLRRFHCRPHPKYQTNPAREGYPDYGCPERHVNRQDQIDQHRQAPPNQNTEQPATTSERNGFNEELTSNITLPRTNRLSDPDLLSPFGD